MNLPAPRPATSPWRTLRAKGWLGTIALVLFLLAAGLYVAGERASIDSSIVQLEQIAAHEKALALTEAAINAALLDVSTSSNSATSADGVPLEIRLYMENCAKLFSALEPFDPGYTRLLRAIERSYADVLANGSRSAWLDLGGNIATLGAPPGGGPWRIAIRHPRRAGDRLGVVAMGEASVSTSGDAEQYVMEGGTRRGHIIDPRSGRPADALVSATVVAASATTADALSTAAVVLGDARAREALARAGADGLLVAPESGGSLRLGATPGLDFHADGAAVAAVNDERGHQQ